MKLTVRLARPGEPPERTVLRAWSILGDEALDIKTMGELERRYRDAVSEIIESYPEALLTPAEAGKILGVTGKTVWEWIKKGMIDRAFVDESRGRSRYFVLWPVSRPNARKKRPWRPENKRAALKSHVSNLGCPAVAAWFGVSESTVRRWSRGTNPVPAKHDDRLLLLGAYDEWAREVVKQKFGQKACWVFLARRRLHWAYRCEHPRLSDNTAAEMLYHLVRIAREWAECEGNPEKPVPLYGKRLF